MGGALDEKGYDNKFVMGEGMHSTKQCAAIFLEAMHCCGAIILAEN
jgi:hypothetical protein